MSTLTRHAVTVDEFEHMIRAGVWAKEQRIELLGGEIVDMPPIGPEHGGDVD